MSGSRDDDGRVHVMNWGWSGPNERSGIPWIGIFLVVFGGLLLLQQVAPEVQWAGSILALAIGLAFLVSWLINRRTSALYVGTIITALTLPDVLAAARIIDGGEGWGSLFLGIAFVAIALVRAASRGGWGWQLVIGGLLVLTGSSAVARHVAGFPQIGAYAWPLALIVLGVVLVARGSMRSRWS
jgi:intracellular septation protein A